MSAPEVWLRGARPEWNAVAMPAAHSLLQSLEDGERAVRSPTPLTPAQLWATPGGAASVGYHLAHAAGSIDRLLTYAAGGTLDAAQRDALAQESAWTRAPAAGEAPRPDGETMLALLRRTVARALDVLRDTPRDCYDEPRAVGRLQLPTTVWGLLFHVAEHTQRHAGQLTTVARIVRATMPPA